MISANPILAGRVSDMEDILEQTAVPLTFNGECGDIDSLTVPNNGFGYGRIDALAAVNLALQASNVIGVNNDQIIRAFPNPVDETVQFEIQNVQGKSILEIFNASGQIVIVQRFEVIDSYQVESVSLTSLSHGIYFYRITGEASSFGGKLVKK